MSSMRSTRFVDEQSTFATVRAAEEALRLQREIVAARVVAQHSRDAADCARFLTMLGLDLRELT